MPINPQEFVALLLESVIPDEIKDAIIEDLLPKMSAQDITDLYELLRIEQKEQGIIKEKLRKSLRDIQVKVLTQNK